MADHDNKVRPEKFLFDLNSFDEDHEEEELDLPPPPPTFSEEELEAAKSLSFEQGRQKGLEEATLSRERYIADTLDKITQNFSTLFQLEDTRISIFERESVELSRLVISKIFPALTEKHGMEEIVHFITEVIRSHQNQNVIVIEVCTDYTQAIQEHIDTLATKLHFNGQCEILANDTIEKGDCKISWKNGGALRDIDELLNDILNQIDKILSDKSLAASSKVRDNNSTENRIKDQTQHKVADPEMETHDD
jgi:flagellar assembly protein FliH